SRRIGRGDREWSGWEVGGWQTGRGAPGGRRHAGFFQEMVTQRLRRKKIGIEGEGGIHFRERLALIARIDESAGSAQMRLKSLPPFALSHGSDGARRIPASDLGCFRVKQR